MSKRIPKKRKNKYKYVFEIFPLLFWKECCCCGLEFRREYGWMCLSSAFYDGMDDVYLCNKCATTEDEAYNYCVENKLILFWEDKNALA